MRSESPALLPIFRSRHQADLLTWLFLHPDREYTATELAAGLDVPLTTLHREAQRLTEAGIITSRAVGRSRLLTANQAHPATPALTSLLEVTFGPQTVIEDEFRDLPGAELVIIFGSWAARYAGETGAPPADIDVLVVGAPERRDLYDAADRAQQRLGIQVNPVIRRRTDWESSDDPLVTQIKASPGVTVVPDRAAA